ncbi:MAG: hypothetical protein H6698_04410 [Myxococcales bacterium]|nr:hypothetical protein [Myxococcales bacterium]MCB9520249.1 hypothetical protein [Myxococcales bacterium]MCB9531383.1 hypothetical protein [Myxococcales bacterium]MCB9533544.1 hypothetical protein [Myxococcales bacterium]
MKPRRVLLVAVSVALSAAACSSSPSADDAGVWFDTGPQSDAGTTSDAEETGAEPDAATDTTADADPGPDAEPDVVADADVADDANDVDATGDAEADGDVDVDAGDADPDGDADASEEVDVTPDAEPVVAALIVTLCPAEAVAGVPFDIVCSAEDADGALLDVALTPARVDDGELPASESAYVLATVGTYEFRCEGVEADESRTCTTSVVAGPAHHYEVRGLEPEVVAGTTLPVACVAVDASGNEADAPGGELSFTIGGEPASVQRRSSGWRFREAGPIDVTCSDPDFFIPPTTERVLVVAGPADRMHVALLPGGFDPRVGAVFEVEAEVRDSFGNHLRAYDPSIAVTVTPETPREGLGYRVAVDGEHVVRAVADVDGTPMEGEVSFVSNTFGPAIDCVAPTHLSMVELSPGQTTLTLRGNVSDANGVEWVEVDGERVAVAEDGSFEKEVPVYVGGNAYEIEAQDTDEQGSYQVCSVLATAGERAAPIPGAAALLLGRDALSRGTPPDVTLAELLGSALTSDAAIAEIDAGLRASNPLFDDDVCLGFLCTPVFVEYLGGFDIADVDATITPRTGALDVAATLTDVSLDLAAVALGDRVEFTVTFSADLDSRVSLSLVGGAVRATSTSASADVYDISSTLPSGSLEAAAFDLAVDGFAAELEAQLEDIAREQLPAMIGAVVSGLAAVDTSLAFSVPPLGGGDTVDAEMSLAATSLQVDSAGLRFGLAGDIVVDGTLAATDLRTPMSGVESPALTLRTDDVALGLSLDLVNSLLFDTWAAGSYSVYLADFSGTLPWDAGVREIYTLQVTPLLPPTVRVEGEEFIMSFACVTTTFLDPLVGRPLQPRIAFEFASTPTTDASGALTFGTPELRRVMMGAQGYVFTAENIDVARGFIASQLLGLLPATLGSLLPPVSLPTLATEADLATLGVDIGGDLGVDTNTVIVSPLAVGVGGPLVVE